MKPNPVWVLVSVLAMLLGSASVRAAIVAGNTELVVNGGFELGNEGTASAWVPTVNYGIMRWNGSATAHSGDWWAGVNQNAYGSGAAGFQTIQNADGFNANYLTLDAYAYPFWAFPGNAQIVVTTGNLSGETLIVHDTLTVSNSVAMVWTNLTGQVAVHHGTGTDFTNYAKIILQGSGGTPDAYFDDVSLKTGPAIPEPGMLLLTMGLGGLLACARRKRK